MKPKQKDQTVTKQNTVGTSRPNENASAIRYSLRCDIEALRSAAYKHVVRALKACDGNVTHAAERLGTTHATLCRWIADFPELAEVRDASRPEQTETVADRARASGVSRQTQWAREQSAKRAPKKRGRPKKSA